MGIPCPGLWNCRKVPRCPAPAPRDETVLETKGTRVPLGTENGHTEKAQLGRAVGTELWEVRWPLASNVEKGEKGCG